MMQRTLSIVFLAVSCLVGADVPDSLFLEKLHALDFDAFKDVELDSLQQEALNGMRLVMDADLVGAETVFKNLYYGSSDSLLKRNSQQLLGSIYMSQSKWDSLDLLGIPDDSVNSISLVKAYSLAAPERCLFNRQEIRIPFKLSFSGTPMIEVEVNGHKRRFWLDTGAGLSVLSSDAAIECGVVPVSPAQAQALTSTTKKVGIQPAVIKTLKIGDMEFENHPSMIIDSKNLEFYLLGVTVLKIDGIIGWNAIKNMDLEMDYGRKLLTIRKPVTRTTLEKNFFWLDYPVVRALSGGKLLYFFLDTGANRTGLYEKAFSKLSLEKIRAGTSIVGGAGGVERFQVKKVPVLELEAGGRSFALKNVTTFPEHDAGFIKLDGILGADALKGRRVHIDATNGVFEIQ